MIKVKIDIVLVGLFLVALSGFALAEDLSDYPDFFVDDGDLDVIVVVGDKAPASHAIAQAQITLSLTNFIGKKILGLSKLASEVDEIDANIISIGNACDNDVSAEILGNPSPCDDGLEAGKATLEFFESGDYFHVVLNALSDDGIKKAVEVLSNYDSYNFEGKVYETIDFDEESEQEENNQEQNVETSHAIEAISEDSVQEDEAEQKQTEVSKTQPKESKIEFEDAGPEPILKEEDDLIKIIINWFMSLFGGK